jgi:hypothetical protein
LRANHHFVDDTTPVGAGLPAKAFSLALQGLRPPSLASQLLLERVHAIILWATQNL